jgi:hypothetical protein
MNENLCIDYTIETHDAPDGAHLGAPVISSVLSLEVESPEVRCMKGDCDGDCAPG